MASGASVTGAIVWFTGLPSSGKSHLARRVQAQLDQEQISSCMLDGDRVRAVLQPPPGYSATARDDFYLTLGGLAVELALQGLIVLVPATANLRLYRDQIRERITRFIEVWLTTPLEECRLRDEKGLYAHFASGQVHGVPGEDLVYEAPEHPEVRARGGEDHEALDQILQRLKSSAISSQV